MHELSDFVAGQRVELCPSTDAWMNGDRFGIIKAVGKLYLHIAMELSGRTLRIPAHLASFVGEPESRGALPADGTVSMAPVTPNAGA